MHPAGAPLFVDYAGQTVDLIDATTGEVREGEATDDGWLVEQNVETPADVQVVWGYPNDFGISSEDRAKRWGFAGPYAYSIDVVLYSDDGATDEDQARKILTARTTLDLPWIEPEDGAPLMISPPPSRPA